MSALKFVVTPAGLAALVNAKNDGTNAVKVAEIGITETAFTADDSVTALPGELKRMTTFSGSSVDARTIHVLLSDNGSDVYSMRGFGLYLDDGTLFGLYGQSGVILEKSSQATLLLQTDVRFQGVDATQVTFGDASFLNPPATTEVKGVLKLATNEEALVGTDDQRGIVPAALKYVLDSRFGDGAPTAFVKGLLNKATAAAFCLALGIKSAAGFDTGEGNGLDADKLDGQHGAHYLDWDNFENVPQTFPPSEHQHGWGDITDKPDQATRWAAWDEVTEKPTTFPPSGHSQSWSTITNVPATASRWPTWSEVTNRPTIPTNNNQLTNGRGYITASSLRTNNTQLTNGRGYITASTSVVHHDQYYLDPYGSLYQTPAAGGTIWFHHGNGWSVIINDGGHAGVYHQTRGWAMQVDTVSYDLTIWGSYKTSSDRRLKTEIHTISDALAKVRKLRGVTFRKIRKGQDNPGPKTMGLIAQEVQEIFPEAVSDDGSGDGYLAVAYHDLIGPLIEAFKEESALREALEAKVARLEAGL